MANQGFPHEGSDTRLLGGIFARLCSALSWDSRLQPPSLMLSFLGFRLYLPLWWAKQNDAKFAHKFLMLRAGWHYDIENQAYILGAAVKVTNNVAL